MLARGFQVTLGSSGWARSLTALALFAYDLQARLDRVNWARLIDVEARGALQRNREFAGVTHGNVLNLRFHYAVRNPCGPVAHPYPRVRVLVRPGGRGRWRPLELEVLYQRIHKVRGSAWRFVPGTDLMPGREMEIPGHQTTDLGVT